MEVIFYYDVVCPYSYIAAQRIEEVVARANATIVWRPVLLGGIYKLIKAPQGKDGSASDVMPRNKQIVYGNDFVRTMKRFNIPFKHHPDHPVRTLNAQRILIAISDAIRPALTHAMFKAYWQDSRDLSKLEVLQQIVDECGVKLSVKSICSDEDLKKKLFQNTQEVVDRGAFGVPDFWIPSVNRLFYGADRLHFVEYHLGNKNATQPRVQRQIQRFWEPTLTFYFDFSSPWAYIASTQIERIAKEADANLEYVPILLGALFKEIGTPNVPMLAVGEQKRNWGALDMKDWLDWWKIQLNWPSTFPIRTVTPLRVAIIEPKVIHILYKAAWVENRNIGDDTILRQVLDENGFNGQELVKKAQTDSSVKDKLKANTDKANAEGCCGVPSFQVNHGSIIWGQDRHVQHDDILIGIRLDVVLDMLCGWDEKAEPRSKL